MNNGPGAESDIDYYPTVALVPIILLDSIPIVYVCKSFHWAIYHAQAYACVLTSKNHARRKIKIEIENKPNRHSIGKTISGSYR